MGRLGSGQPTSTDKSARVAHQGQVEEEFVEDDPRGSFYNDANRRARMIREIELDRIEQVRRAERLSTIPAKSENMEKWREEKARNRPLGQPHQAQRTWNPSDRALTCSYCAFRGIECYGFEGRISNGWRLANG